MNRHKKNKRKIYNKGVTLVETLVSVFILVMATVLPLSASYVGISQAFMAKDQLTASYLAQDALEYIRSKIATNVMDGDPALAGIGACSVNPCSVDSMEDSILGGGAGRILKQSSVTHVYGYNGDWRDTPFIREVWVNENGDGTEIQIQARVEWGKDGARKEMYLKKNMRMWMEFI